MNVHIFRGFRRWLQIKASKNSKQTLISELWLFPSEDLGSYGYSELSQLLPGDRKHMAALPEQQAGFEGQRLHQGTFPLKAVSFQTENKGPQKTRIYFWKQPNFKIQNPNLNSWGTNCHDKHQHIWTGEISTRETCYVSNTTGCMVAFSQRGVMRDTAPYLGHHCWLVGDHQRAKSLLFLEHKKTKITK